MKICNVCFEKKDESEFKPRYRRCRDCDKQLQRNRYRGEGPTCKPEQDGDEKICLTCGKAKDRSEFEVRSDSLRLRDQCRKCCKSKKSKRTKERYQENREAILVRHKEHRKRKLEEDPEHFAKMQRRWREANRFKVSLKSSRSTAEKSGWLPCSASEEEIESAFTGKCDVCGVPEKECRTNLVMDHCHETGAFRGWLCHACNLSAGMLKESHEVADKLAKYLRGNSKKKGVSVYTYDVHQ